MSHARQYVIHGKRVQCDPDATATYFRVSIEDIPVCLIWKSKDPNFTHWHCGLCAAFTRDKEPMLEHLVDWHFDEVTDAHTEATLTHIAQLFCLTLSQYRKAG